MCGNFARSNLRTRFFRLSSPNNIPLYSAPILHFKARGWIFTRELCHSFTAFFSLRQILAFLDDQPIEQGQIERRN